MNSIYDDVADLIRKVCYKYIYQQNNDRTRYLINQEIEQILMQYVPEDVEYLEVTISENINDPMSIMVDVKDIRNEA